jgi:hypothetical protein
MTGIDQNEHWTELYRRALFEEDRDKLPLLLDQAQRAIQERVRELWYSPTRGQNVSEKERRELDAAAYYLAVLRSLEAKGGIWGRPVVRKEATSGALDSA